MVAATGSWTFVKWFILRPLSAHCDQFFEVVFVANLSASHEQFADMCSNDRAQMIFRQLLDVETLSNPDGDPVQIVQDNCGRGLRRNWIVIGGATPSYTRLSRSAAAVICSFNSYWAQISRVFHLRFSFCALAIAALAYDAARKPAHTANAVTTTREAVKKATATVAPAATDSARTRNPQRSTPIY
jgi:hypothetical protein